MGGYSSGRYRTVNRGAVESAQRIDMRRLRRLGFLRVGAVTPGVLRWSRRGEEFASVSLSVDLSDPDNGGTMALSFSCDGEPVKLRVQIVARPCRYGGHRFYFLCPSSGAPVEVLAFTRGRFISLKAARLTYYSQGETELDRLYRARRKAEARARGTDGNPKPRGRNRDRLWERWADIEMAADDLFASEALRRFGRYLEGEVITA